MGIIFKYLHQFNGKRNKHMSDYQRDGMRVYVRGSLGPKIAQKMDKSPTGKLPTVFRCLYYKWSSVVWSSAGSSVSAAECIPSRRYKQQTIITQLEQVTCKHTVKGCRVRRLYDRRARIRFQSEAGFTYGACAVKIPVIPACYRSRSFWRKLLSGDSQ